MTFDGPILNEFPHITKLEIVEDYPHKVTRVTAWGIAAKVEAQVSHIWLHEATHPDRIVNEWIRRLDANLEQREQNYYPPR